jgi:hypothetical protein
MQNDNEYVKLSKVKYIINSMKEALPLRNGSGITAAAILTLETILKTLNNFNTYQCLEWHPGSEEPKQEKKYLCRFKFEGQDEIRRDCIPWRDYDGHPHWITHGTKMIIIAWADVSTDTEKCL